MILYRTYGATPGNSNPDGSNIWIVLPDYYEISSSCFEKMYFKIGMDVYTTHSESFVKAYEAEKIWRALNNG